MTNLLQFTAVFSTLLLMGCCNGEGKHMRFFIAGIYSRCMIVSCNMYVYIQKIFLLKIIQPNHTKGIYPTLRSYKVEMDEMVVMESLDLEDFQAGMERME